MTVFLGAIVIVLIVFIIPILLISLIVKAIMKKPLKKVLKALKACGLSLIPLVILGTITDPATWCEHEYSITSEVASTCTEQGKTVYKCEKCEREKTDRADKLEHDMQVIENGKRCTVCGYEEIVKKEEPRVEEKVEVVKEEKPSVEVKEEKKSELTYIEGVTFDEIYRAYKENELRADEAYQYNRYKITAKINGMETGGLFNLTGGATLTMEKRVGNTIVVFYAEFEKEQEENLKKINVGDTISFIGECLSAGSWVDCELITN